MDGLFLGTRGLSNWALRRLAKGEIVFTLPLLSLRIIPGVSFVPVDRLREEHQIDTHLVRTEVVTWGLLVC